MGVLRSTPDKQIKFRQQQLHKYSILTASACGWQHFMQDFSLSFQYSKDVHVMVILDGQSGPQVAQFCHNQIQLIIRSSQLMKLQQYQAAIQNLCFTLDQKIKQNHEQINQIRIKYSLPQLPLSQETPSSASMIICILDSQSVTIGNIGQCKSYVSYKYSQEKAVLISGSHVLQRQEDTDLILKKGGFVINNMINGKFLSTRAIGNLKYKNLQDQSKSIISSQPSVFTLRLEDLHMIIMGSSGLWERPEFVLKQMLGHKVDLDNLAQQVKNLVMQLIAENPSQEELGKQNVTMTVLFIK